MMFGRRVAYWRRLRCDERGNIAVIFAFACVPLVLLMGGAADLARHMRHQASLSNAVDAASIALGRSIKDYPECDTIGATCPNAKTFVLNYITPMVTSDDHFTITASGITVTRVANGFAVTADGVMDTMFLPVGNLVTEGQGIGSMNVHVSSEVVAASNRLELALVLDNTGSMNCASTVTYDCAEKWKTPETNSKIGALKSASKTLVDTLMADSVTNPDLIKIALVPFEGTVNVASSGFNVDAPPSWIDWNDSAQASTSGVNFDKRNSKNVGHRWLFNQLKANDSKIKWAGCVEMRPGPYELSDTAPTGTIADTRYVPYFWPDEPDSGNANGNTYTNNYLNDKGTFTKGTGSNRVQDPVAAQMSLAKYNTVQWQSSPSTIKTDAVASTAGTGTPYQYGPNKGCPRPIVALTNKNGKATIKTAIDQMLAYWATGTYIPAGLVWGWHVLSPTEPYTQGIAPSDPLHSKTLKAMVLLTDGDNDVSPGGTKSNYYTVNQNNNLSRYSGYGYLAKGRLGNSLATAASSLDAKTATLCGNIKADGIRIYSISFGSLSAESKSMLSDCASVEKGDRLYYHAPNSSDLAEIFREIGEDLSNLHVSK